MPGIKEIKNHISSVKDTQKITGAMYMIASTKMRKAKEELDKTRPFFSAVRGEIKRIFRTVDDIDSVYMYPAGGVHELPGSYAYLVITADKGLAGAYNQNVIRLADRLMKDHSDNKLFVVGEYGRAYYSAHGIPIEKSFLYTAQNPTIDRAREISSILLERFRSGELSKIFIIYTDYGGGLNSKPEYSRILPFHRSNFITDAPEKVVSEPFEFAPSVSGVLENIVPGYVIGFIYSALVDSFCSEQNARMEAMDSAGKNAQKLLDELKLQYNHSRQNRITQEITEVSAGAKAQRMKKAKLRERT